MSNTYSVPVLFVPDLVVLPGMVVPIPLDDAAQATVDAARATGTGKLLVAPRFDDRYPTHGVIVSIVQAGRIPGGQQAVVVKGEKRAQIGSGAPGHGAALWVEVTEIDDPAVTDEVKELAAEYKKLVLAMLQRREAWQIIDAVNKMTDPSALADTSGYSSWLSDERKRELLETPDTAQRLRSLIEWTGEHIAETEVSDKIASDVRDGMEKQQKEFLLRQQLAAIRKELGEGEPEGADDYRARVEAADLPEKVREAALREVGKLERAGDQSPETGWISVSTAPQPFELRGIISPFVRGFIPWAEDKAAPSRAFAKVIESELRLGREINAGETVVDLGASPGSWSYVALKRGAHVIAIDRSELREDLMRSPRLRFETADAFKYRPPQTVDWLICDVIAAPQRSIDCSSRPWAPRDAQAVPEDVAAILVAVAPLCQRGRVSQRASRVSQPSVTASTPKKPAKSAL